jgi:hypothetical protein
MEYECRIIPLFPTEKKNLKKKEIIQTIINLMLFVFVFIAAIFGENHDGISNTATLTRIYFYTDRRAQMNVTNDKLIQNLMPVLSPLLHCLCRMMKKEPQAKNLSTFFIMTHAE